MSLSLALLFAAQVVPVTAGRPDFPLTAADRTPTCVRLRADMDKIEKRLAANMAESAFRSQRSLRLLLVEGANLKSLGQTLEPSFASSGCTLPYPTSAGPYLLPAIKCQRARIVAKFRTEPAECDMARWQPYTE